MKLARYPIVFNSDSVDLGGFVEQIAPDAVDRTLQGTADVVALRNHDSSMPLGRRSAHTLTLEKRDRGLLATVDVNPDVTFASDLIELIDRGDAPGGSFGFIALDDIWTMRGTTPHRTVIDMVIREVSLGVAFPAYAATALRAIEAARGRSLAFARRQQQLVRLAG
jgi:HK97 family phage prohead protease